MQISTLQGFAEFKEVMICAPLSFHYVSSQKYLVVPAKAFITLDLELRSYALNKPWHHSLGIPLSHCFENIRKKITNISLHFSNLWLMAFESLPF